MARCKRCNEEGTQVCEVEDITEVAGHEFAAMLPGHRCDKCNAVAVESRDVKRFENRIAVALARSGLRTGEAMAFQRKQLGLSHGQLAELLDVPETQVSTWEKSGKPVDHRAAAVVASLVLSRLDGRNASLDVLGVLREPRRLAKRVKLVLELASAQKSLEFGSQAYTTPALA